MLTISQAKDLWATSKDPVYKWLNGPVHPLLKVNLTELPHID